MTDRDKVERAPKLIWLQWGDGSCMEFDGATWCVEQQEDDDVQFVRADLYSALQAERDALREALKRSAAALAMVTDPDAIKSTTSANAFAECFAAATVARAALHQESEG